MSWTLSISYLFGSFGFGWIVGFLWFRTVRLWDQFMS